MAEQIRFKFIVTGRNHRPDGKNPTAFAKMAVQQVRSDVRTLNRLKGTTASPIAIPAKVRFIHFNFSDGPEDPTSPQGNIYFYDHVFPQGATRQFPDDTNVQNREVLKKNPAAIWTLLNDPINFSKQPRMSITDVYHAARRLMPRKSLLDISIYSHGFVDGPILVDTNDESGSSTARDPNDRDGRAKKDFRGDMGEPGATTALAEFAAAFVDVHPTFRIYGCDVTEITAARKSIRSTAFQISHAGYIVPLQLLAFTGDALQRLEKKYPGLLVNLRAAGTDFRNGRKPTNDVTIPLKPEFIAETDQADNLHLDKFPSLESLRDAHYSTDTTFFNSESTFELSRSFKKLVQYFARQTTGSYVFLAAESLPSLTCFGTVPGTSADFERNGDDVRLWVNPDTYASRIRFYEKYLDVGTVEKNAERQRNYGIFDAATVTKIRDHEQNG